MEGTGPVALEETHEADPTDMHDTDCECFIAEDAEGDDEPMTKGRTPCNRQFDFGYRQSAVHRWLSAFLAKGAVPKTLLINTCNMVADYLKIPPLTRREMRSALDRSKWLETYGKQVVQVLSRNKEMQSYVLMMMFKGVKYKPPPCAFLRHEATMPQNGNWMRSESEPPHVCPPPIFQVKTEKSTGSVPQPQIHSERYQRTTSEPKILPPPLTGTPIPIIRSQSPTVHFMANAEQCMPGHSQSNVHNACTGSQLPTDHLMAQDKEQPYGVFSPVEPVEPCPLPKLVPIGFEFACNLLFNRRPIAA